MAELNSSDGKRVLFIARVGDGIGYGHFKRSLTLAGNVLAGNGIENNENSIEKFELSFLIETANFKTFERLRKNLGELLFESKDSNRVKIFSSLEEVKGESFDIVFVDRMKTSLDSLLRYMQFGPVVGLDEGGNAREFFPYLIDSFQSFDNFKGKWFGRKPNLFSYSFMGVDVGKLTDVVKIEFPPKRVLVSFGGEDPYALSLKFLEAAERYVRNRGKDECFLLHCRIDVVIGPLFGKFLREEIEKIEKRKYLNIQILDGVNDVGKRVKNYDLIITSYGLTAYEALWSGVPFVLFNPTFYHEKLTKDVGFFSIGVKKPSIGKLVRFLKNKEVLEVRTAQLREMIKGKSYSIRDFLKEFSFIGHVYCPNCRKLNSAIARFADRTYFKCNKCGLVYLANWRSVSFLYNDKYFFEEYKKQYGKTYLEDFNFIKESGKRRIEIIKRFVSGGMETKPRLLDIGCAYGAFLQAASEEGFSVLGMDISCEATRYVREELNLEARCGDFIKTELGKYSSDGGFDVVTMWFVIEHLVDLGDTLKKVRRLLKRGGIFAFSTPNLCGISGRRNLKKFLENSPIDHFFIFSHKSAGRILKDYGFKILRLNITGIHPERFPFYRPFLRVPYEMFGKIFKLGDTFEVFAQKM